MTQSALYSPDITTLISEIQTNIKNTHMLVVYIPQLVVLLIEDYPKLDDKDRKELFTNVCNTIIQNSSGIDAQERALFELLLAEFIPTMYDECVALYNSKPVKKFLSCC